MKTGRQKIITNSILLVLMFLVGLAVTLQFRAVRAEKKEDAQSTEEKIAAYETQIKELEEKKAALQAQYDRNTADYTRKLAELAGTDEDFYSILDTYLATTRAYERIAGLSSEYFGGGITITVNDSISGLDKYNSLLTVHDTTLLQIVNELKAAGAKAISINGERVVPMTEFICVGPAVRVNGTKLFPPFEISAWGDTEELENAIRNSVIYQATSSRLIFEISPVSMETSVKIASYNKSYKKSIDLLKTTEVSPIIWRSNK